MLHEHNIVLYPSNVQHSKFAFIRTDFILLTLTLERI